LNEIYISTSKAANFIIYDHLLISFIPFNVNGYQPSQHETISRTHLDGTKHKDEILLEPCN